MPTDVHTADYRMNIVNNTWGLREGETSLTKGQWEAL